MSPAPPDPSAAARPPAVPPPDPVAIERAAAAAWPATVAQERDGWLLRAAPRVPHRRNNSALPLDPEPDIALVERFYAERRLDAVVAVAPAELHRELDASLAVAGWVAEGHTDVLVAGGRTARGGMDGAGVAPVDPLAWPDETIREDVLARSGGEVFAFAEGQRGAVICIRTGDLAGIFRLHVAAQAQRQGVATRLVAACTMVAPILYAQVEADNVPAQRLFAAAGFARSHGYHYRRRTRSG